MTTLTATVPTTNGSRYLQQLCKHWSHKFSADFTADKGTVDLPFGQLSMVAGPTMLEVRIALTDEGATERAKEVLASHLDRFAFREAPLPFDWTAE